MSYEGRQQLWCKNGHYDEIDAYEDHQSWKCRSCEEKALVCNSVDDTNGDADGYIKPVLATGHRNVCSNCACEQIKHYPATFEIPTKKADRVDH